MGTVYLFAGNYMTGKVGIAVIQNTEERLASAIESFMHDLGRDHFIWEIYNMAQTLEVRELQFNNRLAQAYEEHMSEAA